MVIHTSTGALQGFTLMTSTSCVPSKMRQGVAQSPQVSTAYVKLHSTLTQEKFMWQTRFLERLSYNNLTKNKNDIGNVNDVVTEAI